MVRLSFSEAGKLTLSAQAIQPALVGFLQCGKLLTMAAAERDLFARDKSHKVLAAERPSQLMNAVTIHDDGAMDADKVALRQTRFHGAEFFAHPIVCLARMHTHIVS